MTDAEYERVKASPQYRVPKPAEPHPEQVAEVGNAIAHVGSIASYLTIPAGTPQAPPRWGIELADECERRLAAARTWDDLRAVMLYALSETLGHFPNQ